MTREEAWVALTACLFAIGALLCALLPGGFRNPWQRAFQLRLLRLARRTGEWRQHCRRKAWQRKVAAP